MTDPRPPEILDIFRWVNEAMGIKTPETPPGMKRSISPKDTYIFSPRAKSSYHMYQAGTYRFAYTSYPDESGDYFAWTYKPYGKGCRSAPKKWTAINVVAFKHKGKAMKRAQERYYAHLKQIENQGQSGTSPDGKEPTP